MEDAKTMKMYFYSIPKNTDGVSLMRASSVRAVAHLPTKNNFINPIRHRARGGSIGENAVNP